MTPSMPLRSRTNSRSRSFWQRWDYESESFLPLDPLNSLASNLEDETDYLHRSQLERRCSHKFGRLAVIVRQILSGKIAQNSPQVECPNGKRPVSFVVLIWGEEFLQPPSDLDESYGRAFSTIDADCIVQRLDQTLLRIVRQPEKRLPHLTTTLNLWIR